MVAPWLLNRAWDRMVLSPNGAYSQASAVVDDLLSQTTAGNYKSGNIFNMHLEDVGRFFHLVFHDHYI